MLYISHRINTVQQLRDVPKEYGVELDLRDEGGQLVLQHDPFKTGESFEEYLRGYHHGLMILNIKSERIEHRVLELVQKSNVRDYFFLDSSFPMIRTLIAAGERNIAVRFSEFEPIEGALALAGQIDWVWVDCFTHLPLDESNYEILRKHFKICIVSPELQGHHLSRIGKFARQLASFPVDAVCTKRPDLWRQVFDQTS